MSERDAALPDREPKAMPQIIANSLDAIRVWAREYGVLRLEVFGSVCTDEFDPESVRPAAWWALR